MPRSVLNRAHLTWLDSLGPTEVWLQGVPPAKVSHFAGEARVTDASALRRYGDLNPPAEASDGHLALASAG